ncbi:SCO7613 C-terminal domain-containing membrane protein [Nocardiopsis xinjiangensis]|uniref:SCO7613 C-terminal domain-containing membrane protein n=1 Tax=Nocardiopsis xinjiangensis TaxID=124285 RepID=UPI000347A769|nr:hypothetical protein [Nocardiopsis xinjiangensis]
MHTHDPPLLVRLRRIDRRLLVLDRRVRQLMAEREEVLGRLRRASGTGEVPEMPEGFAAEPGAAAPFRPEAPSPEAAEVAAAWAHAMPDAHEAHGTPEAHVAPGTHHACENPEAPAASGVLADAEGEGPVARRAPGVYEKPEPLVEPGAGEDRASARGAAAPRRPEADHVLRRDLPPAWAVPGAPETPAARGTSGAPQALAPHAQHAEPGAPGAPGEYAGTESARRVPGAVPEVRRHAARNVVLGLGAALMSVAALVFAVWAWTAADTGTRALMLLGVTGAVAWTVVPLHRRGLAATAQALGVLLVVLLAADALLLWVLLGPDVDPVGYTAGAAAVVAALLALHGLAVPLRSNAPVAVVLTQPVPVLTVVSVSPGTGTGTGSALWLLAVVAATALADALVLRAFAPLGLRTSAGVLAATALLLLPFGISVAIAPHAWWAVAATLLLAGAAGLLLTTGVPGKVTEPVCVVVLALAPLAASRTFDVLFPGPLGWWWADSPEPLGRPATEVLHAGWETPDSVLTALGPVLAAAVLGAIATRFLAPERLLAHLAVAVPLTLLPVGLLLGLSHGAFLVWTLALGTAMLLGSFRIPGPRPWALAVGGCATLIMGLWWGTAVQHSLVATLVLFAVLALVCLRLAGRAPARETERGEERRAALVPAAGSAPHGPVRGAGAEAGHGAPRPVVAEEKSASDTTVAGVLRSCALTLWNLAVAVGAVHVVVLAVTLEISLETSTAPWWAASLVALLCAAFGLSRGGAARPAGIVLMPVAVLVAGPALAPVARLVARPSGGPVSTVWEPAHTVLDTSVSGGAATAGAVLAAGAAALALTWYLDRRRWLLVCALVAPVALLPLPIVLGTPFLLAVVTALAVGAGLIALPVRRGVRARARWAPILVGTAVLLWGLLWSLASVYTTALALLALVTGALVILRGAVPNIREAGVPSCDTMGPDTARSLHVCAVLLWSTTMVVGGLHLFVLAPAPAPSVGWWWTAALVTLLCAAVGLCLGRVARYTGVALMPVTVLVAGPTLGPWLRPGPGPDGIWNAPDSALWRPAHTVLGASASEGALTVAALLVASTAVLGVTWKLDRDRCLLAGSLVAPVALVPIPIVLGLPFTLTLLWTLAVGAGLLVLPALRSTPAHAGRAPVLVGSLVLLWGLGWSLTSEYTTALTLLVLVSAALTVLLVALPRVPDPIAARALRRAAAGLWLTTAGAGTVGLVAFAAAPQGPLGLWWVAALVTLLCAAFGLAWGDAVRPVGVALMPVAVLVAGPALAPLLVIGPGVHGVWTAPDPALWVSAHDVLGTSISEGLPTAVAVLVAAAGAGGVTWVLARDRCVLVGSLVAPAALVPVPIVLELPFLLALLLTLAVGTVLTTVAALQRQYTADLWLPGLLGAAVLVWAFGWSLATDRTTVVALLALAVAGAVAAALARTVPVAVVATAVATGATGGSALVVPLTLGLPVEHAALLPIALTAAVAAVAPRLPSPLAEAAEVPASLWAAVALVLAVSSGVRGELVALGLACLGVVVLCSALRPNRRFLAVGGTGLMFAALWTALASWEVAVPEAYTVPPALAAVVVGREWSRRADRSAQPSSWLALGGGLLLLLTPSTVMAVLQDEPAWRILAVVAVGLAVTLWGLRARLKALLVVGGAALIVVSVRAFGPSFMDLLVELPNWLPFAVVGALLLTVGARYEASLRGLRDLRNAYTAMR